MWNIKINLSLVITALMLLPNIVMSQPRSCVPVTIKLCKENGYVNTTFPNLAGNANVDDAVYVLKSSYVPLIQSKCSENIVDLVCSVFTPVCDVIYSKAIPPCRTLCSKVQQNCRYMYDREGAPWPNTLDCNRFPVRNQPRSQCVDLPKDIRIFSRNETTGERRLRRCLENPSCTLSVSQGTVIRELFCVANCFPNCTYQWLKNNVVIRDSGTLSLGPFTKEMNGFYTCRATNILGQRNRTFALLEDTCRSVSGLYSGNSSQRSNISLALFSVLSIVSGSLLCKKWTSFVIV